MAWPAAQNQNSVHSPPFFAIFDSGPEALHSQTKRSGQGRRDGGPRKRVRRHSKRRLQVHTYPHNYSGYDKGTHHQRGYNQSALGHRNHNCNTNNACANCDEYKDSGYLSSRDHKRAFHHTGTHAGRGGDNGNPVHNDFRSVRLLPHGAILLWADAAKVITEPRADVDAGRLPGTVSATRGVHRLGHRIGGAKEVLAQEGLWHHQA